MDGRRFEVAVQLHNVSIADRLNTVPGVAQAIRDLHILRRPYSDLRVVVGTLYSGSMAKYGRKRCWELGFEPAHCPAFVAVRLRGIAVFFRLYRVSGILDMRADTLRLASCSSRMLGFLHRRH